VTTRIAIINAALARIGELPLQSEAADGAATHIAVFDSVLAYLLSMYPWSFARTTWQLARLSTAPSAHYLYAFQLPTDMLGAPRAVFNQSSSRLPFTKWRLQGQFLLADADAIWMEGMVMPELTRVPGVFTELLTVALMAEFALSVREDKSLWASLRAVAYGDGGLTGHGGMLAQCKAMDVQGQPSPTVAEGSNPLLDARAS
jgi:hypothetical protein